MDIADKFRDLDRKSCVLSSDTIRSILRLSVTYLWPTELGVKLKFLLSLRFDKLKMKAKVTNPLRTFVDIRPYYNHQQRNEDN